MADLTFDDCLDAPRGGCAGEVEYRMPLSGTGVPFIRCDHHWELRLDEQEKINQEHPDSPCAPAWFDEALAGERWDDEY